MARDYILRLIDHVALMLAEIVAKRKGGRKLEAQAEIEKQALQHTGLPLSLIRGSAPAMVAELLQHGGELRFIRAVLLAELLLQEAEMAEEDGDPSTALQGYLHAWHLLEDAAESFNREEHVHFGAKQEHARTRLLDLAKQLGVDLATLVPPHFMHTHHAGGAGA